MRYYTKYLFKEIKKKKQKKRIAVCCFDVNSLALKMNMNFLF